MMMEVKINGLCASSGFKLPTIYHKNRSFKLFSIYGIVKQKKFQ